MSQTVTTHPDRPVPSAGVLGGAPAGATPHAPLFSRAGAWVGGRPDASRTTTMLALAVVLASQLVEGAAREAMLSVGLFALSGAVTNWIAIHMLFERVPGLYGSGVIQTRFESIRAEIRRLVLEEFFSREHVVDVLRGLDGSGGAGGDATDGLGEAVLESVDLAPAWAGMKDVVMGSPLGGALAMLGGEQALEPLQDPFLEKTRELISEIAGSEGLRAAVASAVAGEDTADQVLERVTAIIDSRVAQLTPPLIKAIVQRMISEYLGWLVVWGGVFGGLMGLAAWVVG